MYANTIEMQSVGRKRRRGSWSMPWFDPLLFGLLIDPVSNIFPSKQP